MSEDRNDNDTPADAPKRGPEENGPEEASRVRFKGIVETRAQAPAADGVRAVSVVSPNDRRWNAMSRQVWQVSRLTAIFVFFSFVAGLPLGNWFAHLDLYGGSEGWNPLAAYEYDTLLFAFIVPALILLMGYMLSRALTMMNAAESIAAAAQQIVTPDASAAENAQTVGAAVQTQMDALNQGLDGALTRLASVEAMIRQHVEAIEIAGEAIEHKATGAVSRVADERSRLMELTESLNAHADSFAAAIAERANASVETLQTADDISVRAETEFDERLTRLEDAAARALASFEALRDALRDTDETMRASTEAISAASEETLKATERAKAASDAAAESAARNAANVSASAARASEAAQEAAQTAIDAAAKEAERVSDAAVEIAAKESAKVQDAANAALEGVSKTAQDAVGAAAEEASKAAKAAQDVAEAARKTADAAAKASADVAAAGERARQSSEEAVKMSEAEAGRMDERNKALAEARAALERENERLESLIEEQRKRADRLADAISSQTERLSRLAEAQLREQEAAARLAKAQTDMQAQADKQAAARKQPPRKAAAPKQAARPTDPKAQPSPPPPPPPPPRPAPQRGQAANPPAPEGPRNGDASGAARLDELARDIAERRPRRKRKEPPVTSAGGAPIARPAGPSAQASGPQAPGAQAKTPSPRRKGDVSWREILDAAEDAEPLELGPASKDAPSDVQPADKQGETAAREEQKAIKIISQLQNFTYQLETRLYGDPPPALQERFDRGDRNVFANRLLRLNESDVKRRIRIESGRDKDFERGINSFLQGFEKLLEDATTSETADEELEEYLSSPLGRVYLLIGATVGYFA